ncbi:MAG: 16S rRNA (uracil(1498)-N(3))-methyltransferase [Planctomycetaceae bacterium]|nr:16S rRNA (uracil(1498)-N(3))-methyltransferase [Planctomycetaceae bacterium]
MPNRVFAESLSQDCIRITDAEAHHLLNVLRLKAGDEIEIFDGCGQSARGIIEATSRKHADVTITARHTADHCVDGVELTVAAAPPKGDRLKWMVEKLTELGVHQLILTQTERSVVNPGDSKQEKLKANVIAACKQCGRNRLMTISSPVELSAAIENAMSQQQQLLVAHPGDKIKSAGLRPTVGVSDPTSKNVTLFIGPEGGFTDSEIQQLLDAGANTISWPSTILRIETAALALAAVVMFLANGTEK